MKHFVTGGAGFIGSNLVKKLISNNDEVTVYDNMSSGNAIFLKDFEKNPRFRFIKGDLLDFEKLKSSIQAHDFVWHLAANADVRFGVDNTKRDLEYGVIATHNLLEAMRLSNIKKIAFSSSSVIYGEAKKFPTSEDYGPLMPISLYGASKLSAEAWISAYSHSFGFTAFIFRFANIIGKNGTHGILVDFLKKIKQNLKELEVLGDGSQKKSYLLVEDCVDAMLFVVKNAKEQVNIYNLGGPDQISVKRIAEVFLELTKSKAKIKYTGGNRGWVGDVPQMMLDVKKLNQLGWKTKHTSEDAIRTALNILLEQDMKNR
jgi:UDP-glucose 4-epimerase